MPNVILVGYAPAVARALREKIDLILVTLGKADDGITTILGNAKTRFCNNTKKAPHLVVRDTNAEEAEKIAAICSEQLNVDVEIETIKFKSAPHKGPPNISVVSPGNSEHKKPISNEDWKKVFETTYPNGLRLFLEELQRNCNKPTMARDSSYRLLYGLQEEHFSSFNKCHIQAGSPYRLRRLPGQWKYHLIHTS